MYFKKPKKIIHKKEKELFHLLINIDLEHDRKGCNSNNGEDTYVCQIEQKSIKSNKLQICRESITDYFHNSILFIYIIVILVIQIPFLIIANILSFFRCRKKGLLYTFIRPIYGPMYQVDTINGLRLRVYTNDHPPPHFHVVTDKYNAKFEISSCDFLGCKGTIEDRHLKQIRKWHRKNKNILLRAWEQTRPSNIAGNA